MADKIQPYRQPLITATGIILGFSLNVAASWVPKSFQSNYLAEILMAIGTIIHIPLYIIVLYRILNMNEKKNPDAYYHLTLILFLLGLIVFYLIIVCVMFESYSVRKR